MRSPIVLPLVGLAVVIVACGDPYLHTNPYDPAIPVEIDITGPDSLFSYAEQAHYSAQTTPTFPDTAVQWLVDTFTLHRPGLIDTTYNGVTYRIPNRGDTSVDGTPYFMASGTGTFRFDALGHGILALTDPAANPAGDTPIAIFTSRDTTIASVSPVNIRAATVTSRKAGATWIVATRNSLSDSLLVVAH